MDGKFDEEGNLMINRGGTWKHVFCYASGISTDEACCDLCSRLGEPVKDKSGYVLPMCNRVVHFDTFEDERVSED